MFCVVLGVALAIYLFILAYQCHASAAILACQCHCNLQWQFYAASPVIGVWLAMLWFFFDVFVRYAQVTASLARVGPGQVWHVFAYLSQRLSAMAQSSLRIGITTSLKSTPKEFAS